MLSFFPIFCFGFSSILFSEFWFFNTTTGVLTVFRIFGTIVEPQFFGSTIEKFYSSDFRLSLETSLFSGFYRYCREISLFWILIMLWDLLDFGFLLLPLEITLF
ncbi:hypothetical protein MANES_08G084442v8 [Manihot esculenta]|uniref:Uncharacterized protein n=1 Tax=Manihot esculenta TaxID=3983 RepID=A0ACB7HBL3_MANES|nr:hypothetical protein MANES_08G084442v8 [Manihot esculenta]